MAKNSEKVAGSFNKWARCYDDHSTSKAVDFKSPARVFEAIQPYLQDKQCVLDVGVGTGLLSARIKEYGDIHVVGVDYSEKMLAICEEQKRAHELRRVDLNHEELPFKDNLFDIVVSSGVTEFIYPLHKLFQNMQRVTKSSGIIAVTYELSETKNIERQKQESFTTHKTYAYSSFYINKAMLKAGIQKLDETLFECYVFEGKALNYGLFIGKPA